MKPDDVLRSIEEQALAKRLPIIGPDRGLILDEVVNEHRPRTILEVGTLVGYSAVRMGRLLQKGGAITCVELNEEMASAARANVEKAGLSGTIEVVTGDAREVLPKLTKSFDMVFLDAVKEDYLVYLNSVRRLLHPGSVVVADNVKSHAVEVAGYLDHVRNSGKFASSYHKSSSGYRYGAGVPEPDAVEVSVML